MGKRKSVSAFTRFEVFKRDSFTCQYCGASAPQVLLQVDHIEPVARGGGGDLVNLITSCAACNGGKGARPLSDESALSKQKKQLAELQARREQIAMMAKWHAGLEDIAQQAVNLAEDRWAHRTGFFLGESGRSDLARHIRRFGFELVLEGIDAAAEYFWNGSHAGDIGYAFDRVGAICRVKKECAGDPERVHLFLIRGSLRQRYGYIDMDRAMLLLDTAREVFTIEEIEAMCARWPTRHAFFTGLTKQIIENGGRDPDAKENC